MNDLPVAIEQFSIWTFGYAEMVWAAINFRDAMGLSGNHTDHSWLGLDNKELLSRHSFISTFGRTIGTANRMFQHIPMPFTPLRIVTDFLQEWNFSTNICTFPLASPFSLSLYQKIFVTYIYRRQKCHSWHKPYCSFFTHSPAFFFLPSCYCIYVLYSHSLSLSQDEKKRPFIRHRRHWKTHTNLINAITRAAHSFLHKHSKNVCKWESVQLHTNPLRDL